LADPLLIDRITGRPLTDPPFRSAPGPAADAVTRARHSRHSLTQPTENQ